MYETRLEEIAHRLHDVATMDGMKGTALGEILEHDAIYLDALTHDIRHQVEKKARRGKVAI